MHFGLNLKTKISRTKMLFRFRAASPDVQYWFHQSQSWRGTAFIIVWSGVKIPDFLDFFKDFFKRHEEDVFHENIHCSNVLLHNQFFRSYCLLSCVQYWCNRFQIWTGSAHVFFWSVVKIPDFCDLVQYFFNWHETLIKIFDLEILNLRFRPKWKISTSWKSDILFFRKLIRFGMYFQKEWPKIRYFLSLSTNCNVFETKAPYLIHI